MNGMMVAVSPEGVIGVGGEIPWHYRGDLKRLKRVTMGATVIMGRITWESLGGRPLPGRRNVVISGSPIEDVESFRSIPDALATCNGPVWFLGGARIYAEAMQYCDLIDVTYVPDHVDDPNAVHFPPIDVKLWEPSPLMTHEDDPALTRRVYSRVAIAADEQDLKNDPVYGKSYNDLVREIIHLRSQRNDARSLAESCIPLAVQYNAAATERVLRKAVDAWGKE